MCDDKRDQLTANRARLGDNGPEYLKYLEINLLNLTSLLNNTNSSKSKYISPKRHLQC